jgi:hypothetical protein
MSEDNVLTVLVREPDRDRTLMLHPDRAGMVRVQEWDTGGDIQEPTERMMRCSTAARMFQRAHDERCGLTPGLAEIRAWLEALPR